MTKYSLVSSGRPGPTMSSHQPGAGFDGDEAACAEGERPVNSRMALSPRPLSSPQVSYAMVGDSSQPPRCIANRPSTRMVLLAILMRGILPCGRGSNRFSPGGHRDARRLRSEFGRPGSALGVAQEALAAALLARGELVATPLVGVVAGPEQQADRRALEIE